MRACRVITKFLKISVAGILLQAQLGGLAQPRSAPSNPPSLTDWDVWVCFYVH